MGVVKDTDVARRIARAVVSDIALYNAKKVEEGGRNGQTVRPARPGRHATRSSRGCARPA